MADKKTADQKLVFDNDWLAKECQRLSNWGRWGDDDEIGAWNLVTPEKVVRAAQCARTGKVFSLAVPFDQAGPNDGTIPGRLNALHFMTLTGADIIAGAQDAMPGVSRFTDDWVLMNLSASTQWDGFPHAFQGDRMYNNVHASAVTSAGAAKNSVDKLSDRIVTRGVLLDVARFAGVDWLEASTPIYPEDLDGCCKQQGVEIEAGDAVLIRTGALKEVRASGEWGAYGHNSSSAGLSVTTGEWFLSRDVAAVATDTWGFEVTPHETPESLAPLHQVLMCHGGVTIGEMFDLEALADDCAQDGVYEFLLVAPVLPVTGAVNTPVNPQAIK